MAYAFKPRDDYRGQFKAPGFTSNFTKEQAFVTILAAAVHADEQRRRVEEQELKALLGRTRTLHALTPVERQRLLGDATEAVRDKSRRKHAMENACAKIRAIDQPDSADKGLCQSVYAHACDIIHSDLDFPDKEVNFLRELRKRLDLSVEITRRIDDNIKLKNQDE